MRAGLQAKGPLYGRGHKTQIPPRFESALRPGPTIKTRGDAPPASAADQPAPPPARLRTPSHPGVLGLRGTRPGAPRERGRSGEATGGQVGGRRRGRRSGGRDAREGGGAGPGAGGRGPGGGGGSGRPGAALSHAKQRRGGAGRAARGRGLSPHGCFPLCLFARRLRPGPDLRKAAGRAGQRPARGGRSCRQPPAPVRPRRPPPARAPTRGQSWRRRRRPARRELRGSCRFPVLFANFASLLRGLTSAEAARGERGRGRSVRIARAELGGHGRGPERGRGAGAGSPSPGAEALRAADLPAGTPPTPPCSARAPACGWSFR